jgi:hypothetical protein
MVPGVAGVAASCITLCRAVPALCRSLYSSLVGLRALTLLCFKLSAGTFDINVLLDVSCCVVLCRPCAGPCTAPWLVCGRWPSCALSCLLARLTSMSHQTSDQYLCRKRWRLSTHWGRCVSTAPHGTAQHSATPSVHVLRSQAVSQGFNCPAMLLLVQVCLFVSR